MAKSRATRNATETTTLPEGHKSPPNPSATAGDRSAQVPQATPPNAAGAVHTSGSPVPPRAPGSGVLRQRMAPPAGPGTAVDAPSVLLPGQALLAPDHPAVREGMRDGQHLAVNRPYSAPPNVQNPATGTQRKVDNMLMEHDLAEIYDSAEKVDEAKETQEA